jgi:hypothetical protein
MRNQKLIPASRIIMLIIVILNVVVIKDGYTGDGSWYYALFLTLPLLILGIINIRQRKHI